MGGNTLFEFSNQHTKTKSSNDIITSTPDTGGISPTTPDGASKLQSLDLDAPNTTDVPTFTPQLSMRSSSQINFNTKPISPRKTMVEKVKELKMDNSNKKLVKLATKYCTLGLMVFISTMFGIITSGIQAKKKTYLITNIVNFVVFIDGYINFICLHLQYQFSKKSYKILCVLPHSCFLRLLRCFIGNKIFSNFDDKWNDIESKTGEYSPKQVDTSVVTETNMQDEI